MPAAHAAHHSVLIAFQNVCCSVLQCVAERPLFLDLTLPFKGWCVVAYVLQRRCVVAYVWLYFIQ